MTTKNDKPIKAVVTFTAIESDIDPLLSSKDFKECIKASIIQNVYFDVKDLKVKVIK